MKSRISGHHTDFETASDQFRIIKDENISKQLFVNFFIYERKKAEGCTHIPASEAAELFPVWTVRCCGLFHEAQALAQDPCSCPCPPSAGALTLTHPTLLGSLL